MTIEDISKEDRIKFGVDYFFRNDNDNDIMLGILADYKIEISNLAQEEKFRELLSKEYNRI